MAGFMRVYVDETGDRGTRPTSSPYFTFAAVCVRDANDKQVRDFMAGFTVRISKPPQTKVKWTTLTHYGRLAAVSAIRQLPVRLIYVSVPKVNLRAGCHLDANTGAFYNYAARLVVERVSWLARDQDLVAKITFEKVKGFAPSELTNYLDLLRRNRTETINWGQVHQQVRVDSPAHTRGLLVADLAAGAFDSATRADPSTGLYEPTYLCELAPLIWHRRGKSRMGTGLKVLGPSAPLQNLPWWPDSRLR